MEIIFIDTTHCTNINYIFATEKKCNVGLTYPATSSLICTLAAV